MIPLQCCTNIALIHPGASQNRSEIWSYKFLAKTKVLSKMLAKSTILSFTVHQSTHNKAHIYTSNWCFNRNNQKTPKHQRKVKALHDRSPKRYTEIWKKKPTSQFHITVTDDLYLRNVTFHSRNLEHSFLVLHSRSNDGKGH